MEVGNMETTNLQFAAISCSGQLHGLHDNSHSLAFSISAPVKYSEYKHFDVLSYCLVN